MILSILKIHLILPIYSSFNYLNWKRNPVTIYKDHIYKAIVIIFKTQSSILIAPSVLKSLALDFVTFLGTLSLSLKEEYDKTQCLKFKILRKSMISSLSVTKKSSSYQTKRCKRKTESFPNRLTSMLLPQNKSDCGPPKSEDNLRFNYTSPSNIKLQ